MSGTQQTEALRLAEIIDKYALNKYALNPLREVAAELRRQDARIAELEDATDIAIERIAELESQLSAIGAGGVGPLCKPVVPETLVVPDGYALMPIEPTAGICKAAADGWLDCGSKMVLNKAGAAYRSSVAYFMKKGTQS